MKLYLGLDLQVLQGQVLLLIRTESLWCNLGELRASVLETVVFWWGLQPK